MYRHDYSVGGSVKAQTENVYDGYKRLSKKTNTVNDIDFVKSIWYNKSRVSRVLDTEKVGGEVIYINDISFTHDALGRIVAETDSDAGTSKSYVYDMAGRLVRENNGALNKTYTYEYDNVGNVTNRKTYAYTTGDLPSSASTTDTLSYSTTHPDRLTSFGGKAITYDKQGCPLTYDGKTYTWTRGKLTKIAIGSNTMIKAITPIVPVLSSERWEYTYNGNGQRTKKKYTYIAPSSGGSTIAGILTDETVDYTYDHSGRLVQEKTTREFTSGSDSTWTITYLYDCNTIVGMVLNGATYYFHRNIQGDVVGVYDSTGAKVVGFKYDAFGRCTVSGNTTLAQWCKIRYRGYYFDTETGFYWVQTRYYNPEWCRWISPDSTDNLMPQETGGINLYFYSGSPETSLKHQEREQKVLSYEHSVLTQKTINRNINQVANKHVEEVYRTAHLINSPIVRQLVGDVSYTISVASATPKGLYTFISRGNDGIKRGIGYSGNELYYTDDGAGFTVQLTEYFHVGAEASLSEGITFSVGTDTGNVSQEFSMSIGWGSVAAYATAAVVACLPVPGARIVAFLIMLAA